MLVFINLFLQTSLLGDLQKHIRKLETEKMQYEKELNDLRRKVDDLKHQLNNRSPDGEMV